MSKKRATSRSTAIGLGTACIILMASLVGAIMYYSGEVGTLNEEKKALMDNESKLETWLEGNITQSQDQVSSLQNIMTSLNNSINAIRNEKDSLLNQVNDLQSQVNNLKAPRLIDVNMTYRVVHDMVHDEGNININGYIVNVGWNPAHNAKLQVIYYQGAFEYSSDIVFGSIEAQSWKAINENIYYTGDAPTSVNITLGYSKAFCTNSSCYIG